MRIAPRVIFFTAMPMLFSNPGLAGDWLDAERLAMPSCHGSQILLAHACPGDGLEPEEAKLYSLINQYRQQNGLPSIPLSPSLTLVANRHAMDAEENIGYLTHGWSDCPFEPGEPRSWPCMWNAPQRMGTAYQTYGYEVGFSLLRGYATAESALIGWKGSLLHRNVLLNQERWRGITWKAMGIGLYRGSAFVWFGESVDSAGWEADDSVN